jgi:meiotically up-regulated gene 157 (Mug157) protein
MKRLLILWAFLTLACAGNAQPFVSQRPAPADRLFVSRAVEDKIAEVTALLKNPRLAWMFANCFPNTLDTTVHFGKDENGRWRTFIYTGDIHAMWLRDSGAQVWPYVQLAPQDRHLQSMLAGVINCQFSLICIDPYANAFNDGPTGTGWQSDMTKMGSWLHERKWEIDSDCYPIRLAYQYWKVTGDTSVFGDTWLEAIRKILTTFREQQRKDGPGPYRFQRNSPVPTDTQAGYGWGNPVRPVGLIASAFRPSDDATTFLFLVPSNFFAVSSLRKAAEILETVNAQTGLAQECRELADEVEQALRQFATVEHPKYGTIYAYEVDGFGNKLMMDDANVPSLLAMAYLGDVDREDPVYQNTRRFVWSEDNPYFFRGEAAEGIGGPHVGRDMVWPMSILMKAFTASDDAEIKWCIESLMKTDAGTGFMHESFHKDDPAKFTRAWFAWPNTLFGELILKLIADGKLPLLNSIALEN